MNHGIGDTVFPCGSIQHHGCCTCFSGTLDRIQTLQATSGDLTDRLDKAKAEIETLTHRLAEQGGWVADLKIKLDDTQMDRDRWSNSAVMLEEKLKFAHSCWDKCRDERDELKRLGDQLADALRDVMPMRMEALDEWSKFRENSGKP